MSRAWRRERIAVGAAADGDPSHGTECKFLKPRLTEDRGSVGTVGGPCGGGIWTPGPPRSPRGGRGKEGCGAGGLGLTPTSPASAQPVFSLTRKPCDAGDVRSPGSRPRAGRQGGRPTPAPTRPLARAQTCAETRTPVSGSPAAEGPLGGRTRRRLAAGHLAHRSRRRRRLRGVAPVPVLVTPLALEGRGPQDAMPFRHLTPFPAWAQPPRDVSIFSPVADEKLPTHDGSPRA